jgi:hypothetical protein
MNINFGYGVRGMGCGLEKCTNYNLQGAIYNVLHSTFR